MYVFNYVFFPQHSFLYDDRIYDCLGAIDITHIKAWVPNEYESIFRGRKSYPSQNVLLAVEFDLRFTYVLASSEGFAHVATVLWNVLERFDSLYVYEGTKNYST